MHTAIPAWLHWRIAITASLKQGDIRTLLTNRIFHPLGIPDDAWSIGYRHGYQLDGLTLYANWGGATFTARAAARIGQLMLQQGIWKGRELVRRSAFKQIVTYAGMPKPPRDTDRLRSGHPVWRGTRIRTAFGRRSPGMQSRAPARVIRS